MNPLFQCSMFSVLMLLSTVNSSAQCTANAGQDSTLCLNLQPDTFYLGGSPTATGGTAPYTYTWESSYYDSILDKTFTASDFLDDTTAANPELVSVNEDPLTFYLEVTDSTGQTCSDSIRLTFCSYTATTQDKMIMIQEGDSTQIYSDVFGSCQPLSYQWHPNYNISNPHIKEPTVWPDTTTTYNAIVTDSSGCQITDAFDVIVKPTDVEDPGFNPNISINPNPWTDHAKLKISDSNPRNWNLQCFDLYGRITNQMKINSKTTDLKRSDFKRGIYYWRLGKNGELMARGTFIVQ